jgi:hypothetical protein
MIDPPALAQADRSSVLMHALLTQQYVLSGALLGVEEVFLDDFLFMASLLKTIVAGPNIITQLSRERGQVKSWLISAKSQVELSGGLILARSRSAPER